MDQSKTGGLIRALRTQKGLTQKALAEVVGYCPAPWPLSLPSLERGWNPSTSHRPEIRCLLGHA